jgi:hypothetical protein
MRESRRRRRVRAWIGAGWLGAASFLLASSAPAQSGCGPPPVPDPGCDIGPCVDGRWIQHCPFEDQLACGAPPIPRLGCVIGGCVNGRWEQFCDDVPVRDCGPKPELPPVGCRVGACRDGQWQLICNEPIPIPPLD